MEKKQIVIIGIVTLLVTVGLGGCDQLSTLNSEKNKFIGTWEGSLTETSEYTQAQTTTENWTVIFLSNGTYTEGTAFHKTRGFWDLNEGQMVMTLVVNHTSSARSVLSVTFPDATTLFLNSDSLRYILTKT